MDTCHETEWGTLKKKQLTVIGAAILASLSIYQLDYHIFWFLLTIFCRNRVDITIFLRVKQLRCLRKRKMDNRGIIYTRVQILGKMSSTLLSVAASLKSDFFFKKIKCSNFKEINHCSKIRTSSSFVSMRW